MRRVQDYLKELDREKLIETYLEYAPNGNENLFNLPDFTEAQQKEWKYRELDRFIQYLIDMDITEMEDGKTYILFAYPVRVISTNEMSVEYALVCQDDLFKENEKVIEHHFATSPHSEIIGLYIANTPYTQKNIYDLMARVLYEALVYGFQQERIFEEYREVSNPFGIWYKDRDRYIDILQSRSLDNIPAECTQPLDIKQMNLWFEVRDTYRKYMDYCFNREVSVLRKSFFEEKEEFRMEENQKLQSRMRAIIDALTDKEKQVITSIYGINGEKKTYEQLAEDMGITRNEVREIEVTALRRLRCPTCLLE